MDKLEAVIALAALIEHARFTPIEASMRKSVEPHVDLMGSILNEYSDSDCESAVLSATSKLLTTILNGN